MQLLMIFCPTVLRASSAWQDEAVKRKLLTSKWIVMKIICIFLSLIIFLSFCSTCSTVAMESPEFFGLTTINNEQDIAPFEGKLVAFILNDPASLRAYCYATNTLHGTSLKYGSIELATFNGALIGYQLTQIVETGTQGFCAILCDLHVKKGLAIRCAHDEEIIALHQSMKNKQDNFVLFLDWQYGLHLLEKQSGFDLQKKSR